MTFPSLGRWNSNGNFDRRYATGLGRTSRQHSADIMRRLTRHTRPIRLTNHF